MGFYVYNRDNDACKYHSDTDIITHAMSYSINALGGCIAHDVKWFTRKYNKATCPHIWSAQLAQL